MQQLATNGHIDANINYINYLQTFNPANKKEVENARKLFSMYLNLHTKFPDLPELEFCIRGDDDYTRKQNRKRIIALLSSTCQICNFGLSNVLQVHHIQPVSWNGSNKISNFEILCPTCHTMVHHALSIKGVDIFTKDYFADFPEVVGKIENLVRKALEA